jgi:ferredoxin
MDPTPAITSQLRIEPAGWTCAVAPGQSLLEAAERAGFRLARSCRNGTCRTCLCALTSGEVRYRVDWPGLSAEEHADGLTLPCVALPQGDVVLHAPTATLLFTASPT